MQLQINGIWNGADARYRQVSALFAQGLAELRVLIEQGQAESRGQIQQVQGQIEQGQAELRVQMADLQGQMADLQGQVGLIHNE